MNSKRTNKKMQNIIKEKKNNLQLKFAPFEFSFSEIGLLHLHLLL